MSYAEHPRNTVERFSQNWRSQAPESLLAELISISKETNREPDYYHFNLKDNLLIDPNTERPVLDFVANGVEKNIARKLEKWAATAEEGLAVWISPKLEGSYPCSKIIIHRIAYNQNREKAVLNSAILFDGEIANPEYKRGNLYTLEDNEENLLKLLVFLKRKSNKEINTQASEKTSHNQAIYFRSQLQRGISPNIVIQEMERKGFLGQEPLSCTLSVMAGGFLVNDIKSENSSEGGKFVKNCGNCGVNINAVITKGYKCLSCGGTYEGC